MAEKKGKCICPACPSFVECGQLAFCFTGKSKCVKKEKGCICMGCPVQTENKFRHVYYCTKGDEKVQNKK